MYKEKTFFEKIIIWWIQIYARIKLLVREFVNLFTNFIVPFLNFLNIILAALSVPLPQIKRIYIGFKKAEEFMQIAGTTAKEIDKEINKK